MGYKFYILIVLLLFLSLGSVCASGDDYGIEPANDSFANNDTEFIDGFPFIIDLVLAVAVPLEGGVLRIETQTLKVFVEKNIAYIDYYFSKEICIKVGLKRTEGNLGELIINNLHDKPIRVQFESFIKSGFGLSIAQLFFSGTYDYLFRNEVNS